MKMENKQILTGAAMLLLCLHLACSTANQQHSASTGALNIDNAVEQILSTTNEQRRQRNLAALTPDERLMAAATAYARMMANKDQLGHNVGGKQLAERVAVVQYPWIAIGENVANNPALKGEDVVLQQWMRSAPHRSNIMSANFSHIGIGIAGPSKTNRFYYCQIFARPK